MEYGLIGEKLGHSYSPLIHARLADYRYELREVAPEALDGFLRARSFRGLNVTIPYKRAVLPYCAELSDLAREIGCVNTLVVRPDGSLYGHNTDIGGFIHMLRGAGIGPRGRKAVVLGSGGTSLTARTALLRRKLAELLHEHRDAAGLADVARFGVFESGGLLRFSEVLLRGLDQFGKFLHVESLFAVLVERRHK